MTKQQRWVQDSYVHYPQGGHPPGRVCTHTAVWLWRGEYTHENFQTMNFTMLYPAAYNLIINTYIETSRPSGYYDAFMAVNVNSLNPTHDPLSP